MIRTMKARLTYANVTASVALFVALGGTSYAALTLPRNSVGANQIRTAAVGTSELRNRAVALTDISLGARRSLRGAPGPRGATGPAGPPATRYFAAVSAAGGLVRGNAASGGHAGSPGVYSVVFPAATTACAVVASLGATDASVVPPGHVTTSDAGSGITVRTFDLAGNPVDLPFQIVVAC